ncbi:MAG: asparagine synthase-related protein, partial [Nitriliruptorales bacterium]
MEDLGLYRLTPLEQAFGWIPGRVAVEEPGRSFVPPQPLTALEEVLLPVLREPPCFVLFSGGRDSSALLAVAVQLARREALPLPVPITKIYPGHQEADEGRWQEQVIRSIGVP